MAFALIAIVVGVLLVLKSNWIVNNFGYIDGAERYLRVWGGTRLFWKLVGIGIIIIAFLQVGGLLEPFLLNFFGSIFGGLQSV